MARSSSALVALLLAVAVAAAHADLYQECVGKFNQIGGRQGFAKRVPSCSRGFLALRQCCEETKSVLSLGPSGCLCDAAVWGEVERQIINAGINGLTKDRLHSFMNICSIPNAGSHTC